MIGRQPVLMMLRVLMALIALLALNTVNAQNLNIHNLNPQSVNPQNANAQSVNPQSINTQNTNTQNLNTQNFNANIRLLSIAGEPIKLALVVGQEVQLNFEQPLGRFGTPQSIKNKLQTQLIDQRLWLKATKTFKPTRVLVRSEQGNLSVFLLSANVSQQTVQPYPIKYNIITEAKLPNQSNNNNQQNSNTKPALTYVDLTRFAAQSLYAPKRLIKNINLIRVPINTKQAVRLFTCSTALTCNGNVLAHPIATWQSPRLYISAILLKNTTQQQIVLDPRDLLGTWKAATFHFNRLGKANSPEDTSVVYLVSSSPFEQSL
jgi:integrating conjugative element protein (TIGR03749 family)